MVAASKHACEQSARKLELRTFLRFSAFEKFDQARLLKDERSKQLAVAGEDTEGSFQQLRGIVVDDHVDWMRARDELLVVHDKTDMQAPRQRSWRSWRSWHRKRWRVCC